MPTYDRDDTTARWGVADLAAEDARALGMQVGARDEAGRDLPCQRDGSEVVVDLDGAEGPVTLTPGGDPVLGQVGCASLPDYEGQEAYRITTPSCTWIYHKHGAGFASLIDADGKDWLSFRPFGGSDGIYRGIPNLAHPENVFHPGAETCVTQAAQVGPLRVTLDSASKDGGWSCRWHVYPDHAELTVTRVGHPYWLLYEGTPWGALDEERDFCLRSDGSKRPLSERWDKILPDPKWVAFGKDGVERTLWLRSHAVENAGCRDSFWPMEGNMTVFGFGRHGLEKFMTHVPARFTVGFAETSEAEAVGQAVERVSGRTTLRRRFAK